MTFKEYNNGLPASVSVSIIMEGSKIERMSAAVRLREIAELLVRPRDDAPNGPGEWQDDYLYSVHRFL